MIDLNRDHQGSYDLAELTERLRARAFEIFTPLFPQARLEGRDQMRMADITGRAPRDSGSCVVELKGAHAGDWYDHSTQKGGGPLDLLGHATGLAGRELVKHAADLVNMAAELPSSPASRPSKRSAKDNLQAAKNILGHCVPARGTVAEKYLNFRNVILPRCDDILFAENLAEPSHPKGWPAMVIRARNPATGELTGGIHRTYLDPDAIAAGNHSRKGRAPIPKSKLTLGPLAGGVAMLMPMVDGRLGIAEGVESALAAYKLHGDVPVWAGLSDSLLAGMPFPAELRELVIFADRGAAGERAAAKLRDRALAAGNIKVEVRLPESDDDFAKDLAIKLGNEVVPDRQLASQAVAAHNASAPALLIGTAPKLMEKIAGAPAPGPLPLTAQNVAPSPGGLAPGPAVPKTLDEMLTTAHQFTSDTPIEWITTLLHHLCAARLEELAEHKVLIAIRDKTKLPISKLSSTLNSIRRELEGIRSGTLPVIDLDNLSFVAITQAAWDALVSSNKPEKYFLFGGVPCRIVRNEYGVPIAEPLNVSRMRYALARVAQWIKITEHGTPQEVSPPRDNIEDVLATPNPPLPLLDSIVNTPVFSPFGELETQEGYHPQSRVLYIPDIDFKLPTVSLEPTAEEITEAKRLLVEEVLGDFPFDGPTAAVGGKRGQAERAHAIALLLQPFVRQMIDGPTPIFLIDKPSPGSGAGLLVEVVSLITTGKEASPTTEASDDNEMRKKITAALSEACTMFFLDNVNRRIASAALASAVTARLWSDRILGETRTIRAPVRCLWVVTANNCQTSSEIGRRCIARIRLDPKTDRPEERTGFRHPDLLAWVKENRGRLVLACLTVVQAWIAAGRPEHRRRLGSFESWCRVMGGILDVAGIPGFLGNLDDARGRVDTEDAALRAFIGAWWAGHHDAQVGAAELFSIAEKSDPPLALGDRGERSQKTKLGIIVGKMRDRQFRIVVDGNLRDGDDRSSQERIEVRVCGDGTVHGAQRWRLLRVHPKVNLASSQPGSPQCLWSQGLDFNDASEPCEPREPSPRLHAGEQATDGLVNESANHIQVAGPCEADEIGSPGSSSPAFPPDRGCEPCREPKPAVSNKLTGGTLALYVGQQKDVEAEPLREKRDPEDMEERLAIMTIDGEMTEEEARKKLGLAASSPPASRGTLPPRS